MSATPYVGRFAPSPTGCLHIGSLLTATASYLDARAQGGRWLLRMEDLDPPREMPGAAAQILHTLSAFGFEWDGEVVYQSRRHHLYADALATLRAQGRVYPCYCSRRQVQQQSPRMGVDGPVYSGRCAARQGLALPENGKSPAWRLRVPPRRLAFHDRVVGVYGHDLAQAVGDFVLRRADGFWAYQLAVVVDDAEQGVTHVVRGQDLLVSTPRQLYLQQCLGYATPQYGHLPLLTNRDGQKWSKQTRAAPLDVGQAPALLRRVLQWLGLPPPPEANAAELLAWAVPHWCWDSAPKTAMVAEIGADAQGAGGCLKNTRRGHCWQRPG